MTRSGPYLVSRTSKMKQLFLNNGFRQVKCISSHFKQRTLRFWSYFSGIYFIMLKAAMLGFKIGTVEKFSTFLIQILTSKAFQLTFQIWTSDILNSEFETDNKTLICQLCNKIRNGKFMLWKSFIWLLMVQQSLFNTYKWKKAKLLCICFYLLNIVPIFYLMRRFSFFNPITISL